MAVVTALVLLIMGSAAAALVVIAWRIRSPEMKPGVGVEYDEDEIREQNRQGFRGRKPPTEKEIAQQVKPLLDDLGIFFQGPSAGRISNKFDLDRMIDEAAAAGEKALPFQTAKERRAFRHSLALPFTTRILDRQAFHWNDTAIRKSTKLNNDEAVVIARHRRPKGTFLKMRWWVTRRDGEWQIYDFENLDTAWRVSYEVAMLFGRGLGQAAQISSALQSIFDANQALAKNDVDGAERKLAQERGIPLPPRLEFLRQFVNGAILLRQDKYQEALKALEEAHRLEPDMPAVDFLRGVALNRLGKPDQALKHLQAYRGLIGEDADVSREIADAERKKGEK